MKRIICMILIGGITTLMSFSIHKYYASITKIEIDDNEKLIKIYTQLFADDFEEVLQKRYELKEIDFSNLKLIEKQSIERYVINKLQLKANRAPLKLKYLGSKLENELVYLFVEAKIEEKVKRLDVKNTLLQGLFLEQQNTVDITNKKTIKSLHLNKENSSGTIYY